MEPISNLMEPLEQRVAQLRACLSLDELLKSLASLFDDHGVSALSISAKELNGPAPTVFVNSLPPSVSTLCESLFLADKHPATRIAEQHRLLVHIGSARFQMSDDPLAALWFQAVDQALAEHLVYCVPVRLDEKRIYAFLLAAHASHTDDSMLLRLLSICHAAAIEIERVGRVGRPDASDRILTARERECLHLSSLGLTEKSVARQIDISPSTVRVHIENAKRRLGASNKSHAIILAIAHKEIDLPKVTTLTPS